MRVSQQLLAASALATVASAFPMEKRASNSSSAKTFTVNQLKISTNKKLAGPIALSRAIGKYSDVGAQIPQVVKSAAAKVGLLI